MSRKRKVPNIINCSKVCEILAEYYGRDPEEFFMVHEESSDTNSLYVEFEPISDNSQENN